MRSVPSIVISAVLSWACAPDGAGADSQNLDGVGGAGGALAAQIIYVNFDGALISDCPDQCSDAPSDRSFAISGHFGRSEVAFSPYTNVAGKTQIVANLKAAFADYNVHVTTSRPLEGPYTMLIVSPTSGPNHGVAPLDCRNGNPNDIAFVYNLQSSPHWSDPKQISRSATHELGHSFGLEHVVSSTDFMQWASSGNAFTVSTYDANHPSGHDCLTGNVQDAPAMLLEALGPSPSDP